MCSEKKTTATGFLLLLSSVLLSSTQTLHVLGSNNIPERIFNVIGYGAAGDGHTDDTQSFAEAWKSACSYSGYATIQVPPRRTFLLNSLIFGGPCNSKRVRLEIKGDLLGGSDISKWECIEEQCKDWMLFTSVDGLSITGSGTINGKGSNWWSQFGEMTGRPTVLRIQNCKNVLLKDLSIVDSPQMHIILEDSRWVYAFNLSIKAPGDSPNTDGIHIQGSQHVFVYGSTIGTGDDCVSIVSGSSHIVIGIINCGPGHGISIGSLGKGGDVDTVENVLVKNAKLIGTSNGVRIKTWQGGNGYVRDVTFEHIIVNGVDRPIVIDQYYCDAEEPCQNQTSAVHVSNIRYKGVSGISNGEVAVNFACSETVPCTDIFVKDINLISANNGQQASSYCLNANGIADGRVLPAVPCLKGP